MMAWLKVKDLRVALLRAAIVLVPSYGAAYLTESMVWVVPTLAASSFFAASIGSKQTTRNVDEDDDGDDEEEDELVELPERAGDDE